MAVQAEVYECSDCGSRFEAWNDERVYECSRCGGTQVGENRCEQCNVFMAKVADASCPECEAPFDETPLAESMWMSDDGSYHETEAEAVAWDAAAAVALRAEERAAKDAAYREFMDRQYEDWRQENEAYSAQWLPVLEALVPKLEAVLSPFSGEGYGLERDVREFLSTTEWGLRHLRRYDGGRPQWMMSLGLWAVLAGVERAQDRVEQALDYEGRSYDERRVLEEDLIADLFAALEGVPGAEVIERDPWRWGVGSGSTFYLDEVGGTLMALCDRQLAGSSN